MAHFVDALDNNRPFYCDGRDNLKSVAVIEATYISASENRVVFPDELHNWRDNICPITPLLCL